MPPLVANRTEQIPKTPQIAGTDTTYLLKLNRGGILLQSE